MSADKPMPRRQPEPAAPATEAAERTANPVAPSFTGEGAVRPAPNPALESAIVDVLKTVYDPEIPVNVVDLGLIYACDAQPLGDGGHRVEIKMSMTAPGCGMGDVLKDDAHARVQSVPGVNDVDIELIWDPPWDPSRMSEAARLQLGML